MFEIVKANESDISELTELWYELVYYHRDKREKYFVNDKWQLLKTRELKWILNNNSNIIYICKISGISVGYIRGSISKLPDIYNNYMVGSIEEIYVLNNYRRVGIGKLLVEEINTYFILNKVYYIDIHVDIDNSNGEEFWKKIGFNEISIKKRLYIE